MSKLTLVAGVALASLTVLAKTQITPPTLASKEYTGQKQTADVPSSADWIVAPGGNAGGTDAGGYSVMLILKDEDSCEWKPTTGVEIEDAVAIVPFAITKANNSWTTEPSINGWKWGETKSTPVAAAKFAGFGEPSVTYSGTAVDGTAVSGATSILAAGTYTATFKVADTPNYAGLSQDVDFEVTKGDISGGGGGGGGSGVTLIAEGFEGPYDGNKHTVTVSVTGAEGETFDITYSNEENGAYSPTKPSYKNVGSYTVWYKINSKSYAEYRSSLVVKINAAVVTPPAIAPKVYTGEKQVADVAESALYETVVNLGGKDVNSYDVILQLNDPGNYVWKPTQGVEIDGELATLAFAITKAENSWLVQPSMEGWEWGKTASTPVGQSKFGNPPTLTYNGTKADGTPVSGATSITAPGQYTAVFTVADTVNYAGLTESVPFVVTLGKINVDPSDPTEPKLVVEGFEGPYDGENHAITVRIEGAGSEQFNITYSKTGVGEYVAENPQFKNACDTKVWYAINSPNFTALTNSAPMKITKVAVDVPTVASKVYDDTVQTADVAESELYEVVRNNGGKMAGCYAVVLTLSDAVNYCWNGRDGETIILSFEITSDENAWTNGPTAPTSVIGGGATFPVATAKYGDVEVRYSGTAVDGTVVEKALQIVRPGTYTATFKARTTSSWSELTASVPLTVSAEGSVSAGALKALSAAPVSVSGVKSMSIPRTWFSKYQGFTAKFGNDLSKAALMKTGKLDGNGREMQVWQDYVAGTDPTKEDSRLSVKIEFRNGKPKISWTPNQNANEERVGNRVYTVWGKKDLTDKEWTPNVDETTGEWNFFKVTVDMPEQE